MLTETDLPEDHPGRLMKHRGTTRLSEIQVERRRKVIDRIEYRSGGNWLWTGRSKKARGQRYPQLTLTVDPGLTYLANARHVVFYLVHGWVHDRVQRYRVVDGEPMNVHPYNLIPTPPVSRTRGSRSLWKLKQLRNYFG